MLRPGLSLLLVLCVAPLLPGAVGARSCPARSRARLPVPAQLGQQPGPGAGSAGLWALRGRCCTFLALSLLLATLCLGCSLRRKAQRQRTEQQAWPRSCCLPDCSPLSDEEIEALGRQQENSASLGSFLRHLRQRCLRGDALQRARNSRVWRDLDEEAALFSD